jgi:type I restriction enzyme S subunit
MDKYGDAGAVRYGIAGAFNVALGKITPNNDIMCEYLRSYLESESVYSYLHNSCMASTRASLSEANLGTLNLVIPDDSTLMLYEKQIHDIRKSILRNNDETDNLKQLRDWLLPMLMNGQATIAE